MTETKNNTEMDALVDELKKLKTTTKRSKDTETHDKEGNPYKKLGDFKDNEFDKVKQHVCKNCGYVKDKQYFVKDKQVAAGVRNICKYCKNKKLREETKKRKNGNTELKKSN